MGPPFRLSDQPGQLTSINCPVKLSLLALNDYSFGFHGILVSLCGSSVLSFYIIFLLSTSAIKTKTKCKIWETTINMVANYKLLIKEL